VTAILTRKAHVKTQRPLPRTLLPTVLAITLLLASAAAGPAPDRIVAIADVHGAYEEVTAVLQRVGLIDATYQWAGGAATLVQTGDVLDRGARSRECLDLVMALQRQAPRTGGKVITLLGNHEFMNVIGDLRYVTPEIFATFATADSGKTRERALKDYAKFLSAHEGHGHAAAPPADEAAAQKWMDAHPLGFFEHRKAFGPDGNYGKWIRSNPAVVQIGDGIFVHGGVNPALEFASISELNQRVIDDVRAFDAMWRALADAGVIWRYMTFAEAVRFAEEEGAWYLAVSKSGEKTVEIKAGPEIVRLVGYKTWITVSADGPLWYRGLATEPEEKLGPSLTAMLERLKAAYIVAGHSVLVGKAVLPRFESRVFLMDTGMLKESFAGRASALEILDGRFTVYSTDAEPKALPPPASAKAAVPAR
jgi:hypothetical protein